MQERESEICLALCEICPALKEKEEILVLVTKVEKLQESQKEQSIPKVEEEAEDVDWVNVNKEADVDWGEGAKK